MCVMTMVTHSSTATLAEASTGRLSNDNDPGQVIFEYDNNQPRIGHRTCMVKVLIIRFLVYRKRARIQGTRERSVWEVSVLASCHATGQWSTVTTRWMSCSARVTPVLN